MMMMILILIMMVMMMMMMMIDASGAVVQHALWTRGGGSSSRHTRSLICSWCFNCIADDICSWCFHCIVDDQVQGHWGLATLGLWHGSSTSWSACKFIGAAAVVLSDSDLGHPSAGFHRFISGRSYHMR